MKGQQYQFDLWRKQERLPYRLRVLHCDVHCGGVVRNGDAHSPAVGLCCSRFVGLVARNTKREARNETFENQITHWRRPIYPALLVWIDARVRDGLLNFVQCRGGKVLLSRPRGKYKSVHRASGGKKVSLQERPGFGDFNQ
jgi:hypothetical protein